LALSVSDKQIRQPDQNAGRLLLTQWTNKVLGTIFGENPVNPFCPLCEQPPTSKELPRDQSRKFVVNCPRCGNFIITFEAAEVLPAEKYLLSHVCRTWSGDGVPEIRTTNMAALIQRAPRLSILEKREKLLRVLAEQTVDVGTMSRFDLNTDYPLIAAKNPREAAWVRDSLGGSGLITSLAVSGVLTLAGWERIEQIRRSGPNSTVVFVAMSFQPDLNALYDTAIAPPIREAGYEPFRVDRKEHANSIDDEIIGNIRKSRFMVADFTGNRAGVYFEAGMMGGLGRTVIWMCDKKELANVHFDLRQRNFIDWENPDDAKLRLYRRILAIEGEGPNAGATA
jgi:hypothetical protein